MRLIIIANLIVFLPLSIAGAQTRSDVCHVYVVDVEKARKAYESFRETGNAEADAKALLVGQTQFPEFHPVTGEEELTTKTYRLPGSNLIITASVYYTDESMKSAEGFDSMLVGIVTSLKAQPDATSAENNAVSEVTDNDNLDTVRAKKYVRVKDRIYLVGIECHCKERKKAKQSGKLKPASSNDLFIGVVPGGTLVYGQASPGAMVHYPRERSWLSSS
jgi:hypothetical protein